MHSGHLKYMRIQFIQWFRDLLVCSILLFYADCLLILRSAKFWRMNEINNGTLWMPSGWDYNECVRGKALISSKAGRRVGTVIELVQWVVWYLDQWLRKDLQMAASLFHASFGSVLDEKNATGSSSLFPLAVSQPTGKCSEISASIVQHIGHK